VQQAVWRELSPDARPSAWKVGAPNRQTEATAAAVLPQRTRFSPTRFSGETFRTLGIEAEIAFCFGRDLPARAGAYSREEILAAIASAHVAMELVDTRLADPEAAGPLWRLADSLLNGGLILGAAIINWRELALSGLSVRSLADAHCLAESIGRPPLDDLLHCLPWWINHICRPAWVSSLSASAASAQGSDSGDSGCRWLCCLEYCGSLVSRIRQHLAT
jgi:hypothetical protein